MGGGGPPCIKIGYSEPIAELPNLACTGVADPPCIKIGYSSAMY